MSNILIRVYPKSAYMKKKTTLTIAIGSIFGAFTIVMIFLVLNSL